MPKSQDLLARAQEAVVIGKKNGADEVLARCQTQRSVSFRVRDRELEQVEDSTAQSLEIDLYVGNRYSSHRTSDLRADSMAQFIKNAIEMTRFLEQDPDRQLSDPDLFGNAGRIDLDLMDQKIVNLNREQRLQACNRMDNELSGKEHVISASSVQSDRYHQLAMASSNGLALSHEMTTASLFCSISMEGRDGKRPSAGFGMSAVHLGQLFGADRIAKEALQQGYLAREMDKGPSLKTTMLVDRYASSRIVSQLLRPANAQSIFQQRSFWTDRVGKPVISRLLEVEDQPLIPRGLRSRYFDNEGLASHPLTVIKDGKLESFYADPYYARKLKMNPTASSWSNVLVKPGKRSQQEIMAVAQNGVLVTGWIGGNMDPGTGDFSFGIQGFLIENGKQGRPVSEMNVTGNILELFSNLVEVGNDPWRFSFAGIQSPSMAFENVQFSGA